MAFLTPSFVLASCDVNSVILKKRKAVHKTKNYGALMCAVLCPLCAKRPLFCRKLREEEREASRSASIFFFHMNLVFPGREFWQQGWKKIISFINEPKSCHLHPPGCQQQAAPNFLSDKYESDFAFAFIGFVCTAILYGSNDVTSNLSSHHGAGEKEKSTKSQLMRLSYEQTTGF